MPTTGEDKPEMKKEKLQKLLGEVELLKSKRFNAEILKNIAQIEAENEKVTNSTDKRWKITQKARGRSQKEKSVTKESSTENFQEKEKKSQRKQWEKETIMAKADKSEENRLVLTTPKDSALMKRSPPQNKDDQQRNQQSYKYSMPFSYSNQNLSQHQSRAISLQHQYRCPPRTQEDKGTLLQTPLRSTSIAANLIGRNFANHSTINSAASSNLTFKK
uniref:Uncharacterized protein n=1 Tax=Romanomermis culicivorax TaxID=13658 RepID=A0A915IJR5_ROMCU